MDIAPAAFAQAHLRPHHVEPFRSALQDVGVDPDTTFQKDLKLARAKGFKWYFQHGMTLVGSREDIEQGRVTVPATTNQPVEIRDSLKRLQGI